MFGEIIGKIAALPVRLVNVPVKATDRVMDYMCGLGEQPRKRNLLDTVADEIEDTTKDAFGD